MKKGIPMALPTASDVATEASACFQNMQAAAAALTIAIEAQYPNDPSAGIAGIYLTATALADMCYAASETMRIISEQT